MPRGPRCLCGDCKICRKRHYDKELRKARKVNPRDYGAEERARRARGRAFIDKYKATGCVVCGFAVPVALDFHHRDPETKITEVTRLAVCSEARILSEIEKCVLLCANHHRMLHAGLIEVDSFA